MSSYFLYNTSSILIRTECQNKFRNKVNRSHHYHENTFTHYQVLHSYQMTLRLLRFCINIYSPFQLHPLQEYKFFHSHFLSNVQDQPCIPDALQIQEPFSSLAVWVKKKKKKKSTLCSLKYTCSILKKLLLK